MSTGEDHVIIDDNGGNGMPLDEVWVWAAVHGPGDESIATFDVLPLVIHQKSLAEQMRPLMERASQLSGKRYKLIRIQCVEVSDEVQP